MYYTWVLSFFKKSSSILNANNLNKFKTFSNVKYSMQAYVLLCNIMQSFTRHFFNAVLFCISIFLIENYFS